MFDRFSDSECELLINRLKKLEFYPVSMGDDVNLIGTMLVALRADINCLLTIDLSNGFDRKSGIPEYYQGYLLDEQLFNMTAINFSNDKPLESIANISGCILIEEENLDDFSNKIVSTFSSVHKTEAHAITTQRVGQQIFREKLINHWNGQCAVSGISNLALLRASHIKPWSQCKTSYERLDKYNGILLSANLDAAFDSGLISFDSSGNIMFSSKLSDKDISLLSISNNSSIKLNVKSEGYMYFHRDVIFEK